MIGLRRFRLLVDFPFLPKGAVYAFEDESGNVYRIDEMGNQFEYPLRSGLSGYLWLLLTEGNKYLERIGD